MFPQLRWVRPHNSLHTVTVSSCPVQMGLTLNGYRYGMLTHTNGPKMEDMPLKSMKTWSRETRIDDLSLSTAFVQPFQPFYKYYMMHKREQMNILRQLET